MAAAVDATTITNFIPEGATPDILQLSDSTSGYGVGAIGANGAGGVTIQLVNGGLAQFTAAGVNGTAVNLQQVNPGNVLNAASTAHFFELTTGTFLTATAVASCARYFLRADVRGRLGEQYLRTYLRRLLRRGQRAHRGCGLYQQNWRFAGLDSRNDIFVSDIAVSWGTRR